MLSKFLTAGFALLAVLIGVASWLSSGGTNSSVGRSG